MSGFGIRGMGVGESVGIGVGVGVEVILLCAKAEGAEKAAAILKPKRISKPKILRMGNNLNGPYYTIFL